MPNPTSDKSQFGELNLELLRLTFCGIVIASFFAALSATRELKILLSPNGTALATTVLGLSAMLAFAHLLSVASALKFQDPRQVDHFPLSPKVSRYFYDASINIFGLYVLFVLVGTVDARFLHLPTAIWTWPIYFLLFSVLYVVARLAWALALRVIEWHYDLIEKRVKLLAKEPQDG